MNVISAFLRDLLRAHDPVFVSQKRETAFLARLDAQIAAEARQPARFLKTARPAFSLSAWARQWLPAPSFAALGLAVLVLGLFVGREIGATFRPGGLTSALMESKSSVFAMSSPWRDFIVIEGAEE